MLDNITAVGYEYEDIYPTCKKLGGIHNWPGERFKIGEGTSIYDKDFKRIGGTVGFPDLKSKDMPKMAHLMYGDIFPPELLNTSTFNFLSVDFTAQYDDLPWIYTNDRKKIIHGQMWMTCDHVHIFHYWANIANILFCSIRDDQLYNSWPKLSCDLVLHCGSGIIADIDGKRTVIKNDWYDKSFKNCISAGDVLAYNLLKNWPISITSIKKAMKNVYLHLKKQNESEYITTSADKKY